MGYARSPRCAPPDPPLPACRRPESGIEVPAPRPRGGGVDRARRSRGCGRPRHPGRPLPAARARCRRAARHHRAAEPVPRHLPAAPVPGPELRGDRRAPRRLARHRQVADVARRDAAQGQARPLHTLSALGGCLPRAPMFAESDLLRYVEGDCSPAEAAAIQEWIAADPRRGALIDKLQALWRVTGSATRRWDVSAAWRRLREPDAPGATPWLYLVPSRSTFWGSPWLLRIAAALILLLATALLS